MMTSVQPDITISQAALDRISVVKARKAGGADQFLRIAVNGGGCQGFSYAFSFEDSLGDDDRIFDYDQARVVIDKVSLEYLQGGEIDFVKNLVGERFEIKNPNATSSCGCGSSFSV